MPSVSAFSGFFFDRSCRDTTVWNRRVGVENDYLLLEDFANAIDDNGKTMLDARAGRAICAIVQAALESARSNAPVEVQR